MQLVLAMWMLHERMFPVYISPWWWVLALWSSKMQWHVVGWSGISIFGEFSASISRVQGDGAVNVEAADCSKTFFITYQPIWYHITEDCNLNTNVLVVFLLVKICAFIFLHNICLSVCCDCSISSCSQTLWSRFIFLGVYSFSTRQYTLALQMYYLVFCPLFFLI
jgi:hypothetical protein